MEKSIGFVILRHVNSQKTNLYWQESYQCIRNFYPENKIIIIDDNSNNEFITERELWNTEIIQSEYPGRGELLPYYYYLKHHWFEIAVFIHDSVFINKKIDFFTEKYKLLWHFEHMCAQEEDETHLLSQLNNNSELLQLHKLKDVWRGCFGAMCIINYQYLKTIDERHCIENLLPLVTTRYNRMSFERVIGCILELKHKPSYYSLLGNIHSYCKWLYSYEEYIQDKENEYLKLPLIKIWSGR
jgi:hypothetical protein